jgi:hypothetical protein
MSSSHLNFKNPPCQLILKPYENHGVLILCLDSWCERPRSIYTPWFQAFAMFQMLRVIFWVVPWGVVFNSRRFRTLCLFHLHRRVDMKWAKSKGVWLVSAKLEVNQTKDTRLWRWNRRSVLKHRLLTLWHTQTAVSRSESPMSLLLVLAFCQ